VLFHAVLFNNTHFGTSGEILYKMKRLLLTVVLISFISCGSNEYKILDEDVNANISRIQVRTKSILPKNEIREIALNIREDRESYDKVWITFFVPEQLPDKDGNGAWASASFTPNLEIMILE